MAKKQPSTFEFRRLLWPAFLVFFFCAVIVVSYISYLFFNSPPAIRDPYLQHYHFRMQIIIDGQKQNFAGANYQTAYSKVSCTATLPAEPIHFHDGKDQIVHIHWDGMTGGMVLKYYGWNFIGGMDSVLGYRFDELPNIKKVPIHGNELPGFPVGEDMFIYSGNEDGYKERVADDFIHQDLEKFFKPSSFPSSKIKSASALDSLFPKAYAHEVDGPAGASEAQLEQINNLLGNVVIFVQKNKPNDAQVKDRFNHLEPLSKSVCGG